MAQKDTQETVEYYRWLLRIERQQFEEELLEIVSIQNRITGKSIKNKCLLSIQSE